MKPYLVYFTFSFISNPNIGTKKPGTAESGTRKKAEIMKLKEEAKTGELTNPNAIIIPNSEIQRMKVL